MLENLQHVIPQVAGRRVRPTLRQALHRQEFRHHRLSEAEIEEQAHRFGAARMRQHATQLLGDAFGTDDRDLAGHRADRRLGSRVDGQREAGRHADAAEHTQLVFREAMPRLADGAEDLRVEIGPATNIVEQLIRDWIEEHAIDREVATTGVLFGRGEDDLRRASAVFIADVGAERRHLNRREAPFLTRTDDLNDAKRRPDRDRAREQLLNARGPSVGRDVVILRHKAKELIAHASAGPQSLEAVLLKPAYDRQGEFAFGHRSSRVTRKRQGVGSLLTRRAHSSLPPTSARSATGFCRTHAVPTSRVRPCRPAGSPFRIGE